MPDSPDIPHPHTTVIQKLCERVYGRHEQAAPGIRPVPAHQRTEGSRLAEDSAAQRRPSASPSTRMAPASKSAVSSAIKLGALFKGGVFYGDLSTDIYFAASVYSSDGADSDRIGVFTAVVACILLFPIIMTIIDVATKAKGGMGWFGAALNLTFTRILCVSMHVLPPVQRARRPRAARLWPAPCKHRVTHPASAVHLHACLARGPSSPSHACARSRYCAPPACLSSADRTGASLSACMCTWPGTRCRSS